MAETWSILEQLKNVTAAATLYTVPSGKQIIAELVITNRTGAAINVRWGIATGGAADDDKQWELYDFPLAATDTKTALVVADETDLVRIYASATGTSWTLKGVEFDS